ncbi:uncharacterized protein HaLaN_07173, partial [Haematococcus lacustris]
MMRRALLLPPFLLLAFSLSGVLAREVPASEVITSPIPTTGALNATGEDASTAAAVANHTWPSLEQLQLCGYAPLPGVGAEASGVAYMPPTDTWWVVSPVPRPALHELSGWPALRPLRALPLGPQVNDPEGVTWLGGSLLAVVNEDGGQVVEVDTAKADGLYMQGCLFMYPHGGYLQCLSNPQLFRHRAKAQTAHPCIAVLRMYDSIDAEVAVRQGQAATSIYRLPHLAASAAVVTLVCCACCGVATKHAKPAQARVLAAPLDVAQEDNKGFEGIAAGLQPNEIYLAQQDMPRRVIKLDVATGTGEELFDLDADLPSKQGKGIKKGKKRERTPLQETASKLKELSDLVVAPSGLLYILSQASKTVALVTPEGRLLQHKEVDLPRPEGLAFKADGSAMMVVSEGQVPTAPSTMAYFAVNCSAV